MTTPINQLPSRGLKISPSDLFPFFSNMNGDAAKVSLSIMARAIGDILGIAEGFTRVTQYKAVNDDLTVSIQKGGVDTWLILTPATTGLVVTVRLPEYLALKDGVEVSVNTATTCNLSFDSNGAQFYGDAFETFDANMSYTVRYNQAMNAWFPVAR